MRKSERAECGASVGQANFYLGIHGFNGNPLLTNTTLMPFSVLIFGQKR
jgi:hypothetical protein